MRINDNPLSDFRPMLEAERDREMRKYFEGLAAEEQAEAAIRAARQRKPDKAPDTVPPTGVERLHLDAATAEQGGISAKKTETTSDPEFDSLHALIDEIEAQDKLTSTVATSTHTPDTVTIDGSAETEITASASECTTLEAVAATGAATSMPVVVAATDSFPVHDGQHLGTEDEPAARLQVLCSELACHHDYHAVRAEYCELSIRMNLVGRLAPAFRPELKAGGRGPIYQLIHRDQLVIDMHWCHTQRFSLSPIEPEHAALFASHTSFSFTKAWALANRVWTDAFRAGEALCLTTFQQCQLCTLRDAEFATRAKSLTAGYRESGGKVGSKRAKAKRAIAEWIERDQRLKPQQQIYELLWLARELLGHGASPQQIADLQALMSGTGALDRRTVSDKIKKLDKVIAST